MRAHELVERALAATRSSGCVVIVDDESSANLRWAANALTTDGASARRRVTVIATAERAGGTATGSVSYTGAVDTRLIADLVGAADQAAAEAVAVPDAPPLVPGRDPAPGWADPVEPTSPAVLSGVAAGLGEAFRGASACDRLLYGYAEHTRRRTLLGSSTGLRRRHDQPAGHLQLTGRDPDSGQAAWVGAATDDFNDVHVEQLSAEIGRRLEWARRRVELPPGRYECILPPAAVADLMTHTYWAAGAADAIQGRSVFSAPGGGTRIGERLTPFPLTLRGDPAAAGLACAPFVVARTSDATTSVFDNGWALRPTTWLESGVLRALLQTRADAGADEGMVTPHIDNLILESVDGVGSEDDLVARTERALLLTGLWYIREVDPANLLLTGLTRDGVYLVEHGEIVGSVNNFRFNESPVDMLGRVREVGETVRTRAREWGDGFSAIAMPPLRVADFHMSSVSEAI
ncbi:metallopeptidase TldD-related protein [Micromonospora sp. NPDC003776]